MTGVVASVSTAPGAFVEEGKELFHVVDPDRLWLEVQVPEADIGRIGKPSGAWFEVQGFDRPFTVDPKAGGKVVAFGGVVDAQSRTTPLIFEVGNPGRALRVGMFAKVHVLSGQEMKGLAIPASAVVDDGKQEVAFVLVSGEAFERRPLKLGVRDGEWVQVLDGLAPGDRVVTRGAWQVRLAAAAGAHPRVTATFTRGRHDRRRHPLVPRQPPLRAARRGAAPRRGQLHGLEHARGRLPGPDRPTVTVITEAHGMAPEEAETQIAFPIETVAQRRAGVRRVRSASAVGIAIVWVEFDWGTDIYQARQIVAEKLQLAASSLPPGADRPTLAPISSIMGEILFIALTSDRHDPMELKTTADWVLRKRLLAVPGVSQVIPTGGETKQYQVILRPERLSSYGIAVDEVVRALEETNENTSAGFYLEGGQQYLIHGIGRVRRAEDIGETFVAMRGGEPVLVRQLGDVRIGPP